MEVEGFKPYPDEIFLKRQQGAFEKMLIGDVSENLINVIF